MLNLQRGFLQTQFSKDWIVVMLTFWTEHSRKDVAQTNLSTKLNIVCAWCHRQLAKQGWTLTVTVAEHSARARLWTTEMFYKHPPTAPSSRKMQYLETTVYAAFEILKEKFQYVSDQLELNSKQHQAMKGRFVSYLLQHVVIGFNSSCYDIHWRKRTCWDTCFCLVLLQRDKRSEGYGTQKSRMS